MTYSIAETFNLLIRVVGNKSAEELLETCRQLGMTENKFIKLGNYQALPNFDSGYVFSFNTDNDETAKMEILVVDNRVLQAGIQIIYKQSLFFSNLMKQYKRTVAFMEEYYGAGVPMDVGNNMEIMNFGDIETVSYVSKIKVNGRDSLTLKVGNAKLWNN